MPIGKRYSKSQRKYVDIERERPLDYSQVDGEAAGLLVSYWRWWPDKFLDLLLDDNADFDLEPIQRMNMRAFCRYVEAFITGGRGLTKTYAGFLSRLVMGLLWPGIKMQYYGPTLKQTAEIVSGIWKQIQKNYPALGQWWDTVSDASDRFELRTKFGSEISITTMRGSNASSVCAEEVAQSEVGKAFNHEEFRGVVLPAIRIQRNVKRKADPYFPNFQKLYITSAGQQQNESFEYRAKAEHAVRNGRSAFVLDIPSEVAVIQGIRNVEWYADLEAKLSPEERLREMKSIWTGTSENPVIRDLVLTESKTVQTMEYQHCGDPSVIYVIGYDVSYKEGAKNAKCAFAVFKCEVQEDFYKRDKFRKSLVWVSDNPPPRESTEQAKQLKKMWAHFSMAGGEATYIVIDANQYGNSVLEDLHKDLGDGLPPLCCINHEKKELELDGALPVIYALVATGGFSGVHDPEGAMLEYAEREWEHRNVHILTSNLAEGIKAYKLAHRIKTDDLDSAIALPYIKTRELCGQISNLKKKVSGLGMSEERISRSIQRDMWSATKYALRLVRILEDERRAAAIQRKNPWGDWGKSVISSGEMSVGRGALRPRCVGRIGGNAR